MEVYHLGLAVRGGLPRLAGDELPGRPRSAQETRKSVDLAGSGAGGAISLPLALPTSAPVGSAVALGVRPEHLHPAP